MFFQCRNVLLEHTIFVLGPQTYQLALGLTFVFLKVAFIMWFGSAVLKLMLVSFRVLDLWCIQICRDCRLVLNVCN